MGRHIFDSREQQLNLDVRSHNVYFTTHLLVIKMLKYTPLVGDRYQAIGYNDRFYY